ncbi:hypothetical protein GCM10010501_75060 [Streptomyces libani subsp. rufus]|nr:hypothetical protein GCM10010501_75060 [Streptomyces libani subsp. rufus]
MVILEALCGPVSLKHAVQGSILQPRGQTDASTGDSYTPSGEDLVVEVVGA